MRTFAEYHPVAVAVCLLCTAAVAMFLADPVILAIALPGAVAVSLHLQACRGGRVHLFTLGLLTAMALVNPLVSHRGETVLFVLNHNPVTLEATVYGLLSGGMVAAVLYTFRSFTKVMTTDRLLCLTGALSPRLALVVSMALRYVPLFQRQYRKTRQAQTALGLFAGDAPFTRLRGELRVFSSMVTWALENGVTTADSMAARGYGVARRTHFTPFRFTWRDALLTLLSLGLAAFTLWAGAQRGFTCYPRLQAAPVNPGILAGYAAYALLTLLPLIIDGKEALRWRILHSRT